MGPLTGDQNGTINFGPIGESSDPENSSRIKHKRFATDFQRNFFGVGGEDRRGGIIGK